jgi:uncharacterized membrane protein YdbT with pleckstrin-like domain
MKKLGFYTPTLVAVFAMAPMIASAQTFVNLTQLLNSFNVFLNTVVVPVVFAIALVVFLWGVVQTFILGGAHDVCHYWFCCHACNLGNRELRDSGI